MDINKNLYEDLLATSIVAICSWSRARNHCVSLLLRAVFWAPRPSAAHLVGYIWGEVGRTFGITESKHPARRKTGVAGSSFLTTSVGCWELRESWNSKSTRNPNTALLKGKGFSLKISSTWERFTNLNFTEPTWNTSKKKEWTSLRKCKDFLIPWEFPCTAWFSVTCEEPALYLQSTCFIKHSSTTFYSVLHLGNSNSCATCVPFDITCPITWQHTTSNCPCVVRGSCWLYLCYHNLLLHWGQVQVVGLG